MQYCATTIIFPKTKYSGWSVHEQNICPFLIYFVSVQIMNQGVSMLLTSFQLFSQHDEEKGCTRGFFRSKKVVQEGFLSRKRLGNKLFSQQEALRQVACDVSQRVGAVSEIQRSIISLNKYWSILHRYIWYQWVLYMGTGYSTCWYLSENWECLSFIGKVSM